MSLTHIHSILLFPECEVLNMKIYHQTCYYSYWRPATVIIIISYKYKTKTKPVPAWPPANFLSSQNMRIRCCCLNCILVIQTSDASDNRSGAETNSYLKIIYFHNYLQSNIYTGRTQMIKSLISCSYSIRAAG